MAVKVGCCGFPMAKAEYYRRFPVAEQCAAEAPTYVLFNNLFMGEDALRFQKLLAQPVLRVVRPARQGRA